MSDEYNSIAPKFRSRNAFVKEMEKNRAMKIQRGDFEFDSNWINAFLNASNELRDSFSRGLTGFGSLTHPEKYLFIADCITNGGWNLSAYRNTWIKILIECQLKLYKYKHAYAECTTPALGGGISLPIAFGDLSAMMAIFGNRELFENTVKLSLDCFDHRLAGGDITYLTQLFILQLSEKFLGYTPRNWLEDKHWGVDPRTEEPLFEELWNHWDDSETGVLEPLLIQLLNRHTFQASRNNKDGGRDFEGHSEQYPMEVHFIFRLREWRGLNNPTIKHRLMEAPFDVLPEPMQHLVFDEQTIRFMKKVRSVFPDFDTVVNNAKIRDWKMLL